MKRKKNQRQENARTNSNEQKCSNDEENCTFTPESCVALLNSTLSAVVEPKENIVCNQLNIKPITKPLDFSYESNSDGFILQIDSSILKAASDYVKQNNSRSKSLFNILPSFDVDGIEWQESSELFDNLGQNEIISLNSEVAPSDINLLSCSTNGIHFDILNIPVEENGIIANVFSHDLPISSENLESVIVEQIYTFDFNVGANIVCTDDALGQLPENIDGLSIDSFTKVSTKVKKRKNNFWHPKKRSRKKAPKIQKCKNGSCTVPNDDSCDGEESQELVFNLTTVPDIESCENTEISTKIHKQLEVKTTSPVTVLNGPCNTKRKRKRCIWDTKKRKCKKKNMPVSTKSTETIEPNLNNFCDTCDEDENEDLTKNGKSEYLRVLEMKKRDNLKLGSDSCSHFNLLSESKQPVIDSSTTISDIEKRQNIGFISNNVLEANINSPITVLIGAGSETGGQLHNTKRKRKRCIWDTKKRKCKKSNKPLKVKNAGIILPMINESLYDTCDEEDANELTLDGKCEVLRLSELREKENLKSSDADSQHNLLDTGQNFVGTIFKIDPKLNNSQTSHEYETEKLFGISKREYFRLLELKEKTCFDSQLDSYILPIPVEAKLDNRILYNSNNEKESQELIGEKYEFSELRSKKMLKKGSSLHSNLNSLDIYQTTLTKNTQVVEKILNNKGKICSTCDADETEEVDENDNSDILRHAELSAIETSKISSDGYVSNSQVDNVLSPELILMEDDLDFEPDLYDQTNTEIPSNSHLINTPSYNTPRTVLPVSSNAASDKTVPVLENSDKKSEELYPKTQTNLKICNELALGISVKPSIYLPQIIDFPSYLNLTNACGTVSEKRNVPSEDDSDSDHDYSFKRSRHEKKSPVEGVTNNYISEEFNVNKISTAQNEVIRCENERNSLSDDFGNTSYNPSLSEHHLQDALSPSDSSLCSSKSDKAVATSVKSQVSLGHFYRLDDVVSEIRCCYDKKLVYEAVEIAETYMAVSYSDDNALLMQELFSSLLSLISSGKIKDISFTSVFDKLLKLIQDYNIYNDVVSDFIINCSSNTAMHIYAIKMFHSCQERKMPLRSSAIKIICSLIKSEEISAPVLLDFLKYIKLDCGKKMPKDLLHMALKKFICNKVPIAHDMCSLLHNVTFKEIDIANLQEFLVFCFKQGIWVHIANMFIAWGSRYDLLECVYNALASTSENIGDYFMKFADCLLHEHFRKLSSYQVYYIGQMGIALMLCAFSRCDLRQALEVLYTLHAHNINYFEQARNTCKFYANDCCKDANDPTLAFPFLVVFIAIDVCLHFKRPKDAVSIFQGFSWIIPDESLCGAIKVEVINHRFKCLLKLVQLLKDEMSLNDGWEALKMLLLTIEHDLALEDLKRNTKDLQNIYNSYLVSFMNSGKISCVKDLYQHSFGPFKEIFKFAPDVLRGLVVTFVEDGMLQDASSLFMLGIINEIYCMEKPEPDGCPWLLTLMTNWTVQEMKLAVHWFLEALFPLLTDKRANTDFQQWFSLRIVFEICTENCSEVHCIKVSATDPESAAKRAAEVFENLNPSLEIIQEVENSFSITSNSLYNLWKSKCTSTLPILSAFPSNFLQSKKNVSFGRDNSMSSEENSQISSTDLQNSGFKLKESKNIPIFSESLHLKSRHSEFLKNSQSAECIVSGMIGKIRANISKFPPTSSEPCKNALSDNFNMPKLPESPDLEHNQQSTTVQSNPKFKTSPLYNYFKTSTPRLSNVNDIRSNSSGLTNATFEKLNSPNKLLQNMHSQNSRFSQGVSSRSTVSGSGDFLSTNTKAAMSSSLISESQTLNTKICDGILKNSPIKTTKSANQFTCVSHNRKSSSQQKKLAIKLVSNRQNYSEKSKSVTSSIEALSNFHVVKISNEILLAPNHKVRTINQEKNHMNVRSPGRKKLSQGQRARLRMKRAKLRASLTTPSGNPPVMSKASETASLKLKDCTITKAGGVKFAKNPGRSFDRKQKFQNFTVCQIPTTSKHDSESSNLNMHSSYSQIIRREMTSQGESVCNKEEFQKIIHFLKIKVIQKYKNLTTPEQHRKAVALTETFLMNNNVKAVDKKIMKLLTEFAISNV